VLRPSSKDRSHRLNGSSRGVTRAHGRLGWPTSGSRGSPSTARCLPS